MAFSETKCDSCLFRMLSSRFMKPEEFELIRRTSTQLSFKKGEVIFKQGNKSQSIGFLHRGMVKVSHEINENKNYILTIVTGPKLLGGANLFFKETNVFSMVALEDCEVCFFSNQAIMKIISENNKYLMALLGQIVEMYQPSIFNFISLSYKQVTGRIADILLFLSDNIYKSDSFTLNLTRKELSEFAACSPENVITTLSTFNKEGIIKLDNKKIEILNKQKLVEISKKA